MTEKDIKTFKLKARGDAGAGKTELLVAFAALLRQFGMSVELCDDDHHLVVTATKAQRNALYQFNRKSASRWALALDKLGYIPAGSFKPPPPGVADCRPHGESDE
jgi:uridine kinase